MSRARDALRAEWTKLRTLPGTVHLLLGLIALTVALGLVADAAAGCPSARCGLDPARTSLTGIYLGQAAAVVLAVLSISGEYAGGMIRVTFAAMPRRTTVLAAKAVTVTGLTLSAGAPAVLGSLLAGRLVLPGHGLAGAPPGPMLRAAAGSVLYLGLIALLSLGIAAAVRDAAAAIGTVLALLYLLPLLATRFDGSRVARLAPMTAGLAVQATTGHRPPIAPWAGLGVLAAWAAAALVAGGLLLHFRDA